MTLQTFIDAVELWVSGHVWEAMLIIMAWLVVLGAMVAADLVTDEERE